MVQVQHEVPFGYTLVYIDGRSLTVSRFLVSAFECIRRDILCEGLFRKTGNCGRQKQLKDCFTGDVAIPAFVYVHDVANIIKEYVRMHEPPMIPLILQPFMSKAAVENYNNRDKLILLMLEYCHLIPQLSRDMLSFVCSELKNVAQHSDANKMNCENLARVFAPTFFSNDLVGDISQESVTDDMTRKTVIVRILIENAHHIGATTEVRGILSPSFCAELQLSISRTNHNAALKKKETHKFVRGFKRIITRRNGHGTETPTRKSTRRRHSPCFNSRQTVATPQYFSPPLKRAGGYEVSGSCFSGMKESRSADSILEAVEKSQDGDKGGSSWFSKPKTWTKNPKHVLNDDSRTNEEKIIVSRNDSTVISEAQGGHKRRSLLFGMKRSRGKKNSLPLTDVDGFRASSPQRNAVPALICQEQGGTTSGPYPEIETSEQKWSIIQTSVTQASQGFSQPFLKLSQVDIRPKSASEHTMTARGRDRTMKVTANSGSGPSLLRNMMSEGDLPLSEERKIAVVQRRRTHTDPPVRRLRRGTPNTTKVGLTSHSVERRRSQTFEFNIEIVDVCSPLLGQTRQRKNSPRVPLVLLDRIEAASIATENGDAVGNSKICIERTPSETASILRAAQSSQCRRKPLNTNRLATTDQTFSRKCDSAGLLVPDLGPYDTFVVTRSAEKQTQLQVVGSPEVLLAASPEFANSEHMKSVLLRQKSPSDMRLHSGAVTPSMSRPSVAFLETERRGHVRSEIERLNRISENSTTFSQSFSSASSRVQVMLPLMPQPVVMLERSPSSASGLLSSKESMNKSMNHSISEGLLTFEVDQLDLNASVGEVFESPRPQARSFKHSENDMSAGTDTEGLDVTVHSSSTTGRKHSAVRRNSSHCMLKRLTPHKPLPHKSPRSVPRSTGRDGVHNRVRRSHAGVSSSPCLMALQDRSTYYRMSLSSYGAQPW